jgi:hypothetical protein
MVVACQWAMQRAAVPVCSASSRGRVLDVSRGCSRHGREEPELVHADDYSEDKNDWKVLVGGGGQWAVIMHRSQREEIDG